MNRVKGHLAIILSCIIFATNIIATSALTKQWLTPMGYTMTRLLYGTAAFWIMGLFVTRERIGKKDLLILAAGGLLGFIISQLAFSMSVRYTSPVNFSLIMAMVPILTLILSAIFLKEKIRIAKVAGIVLSIVGACVIILQNYTGNQVGENNLLGIAVAFVSMASYGIYLMITGEVTKKFSSITIMKWMYLFCAAMLLPIGFGELVTQKRYTQTPTMTAVLQLAFVLCFDTTIVFFFLLTALNRLSATTVSTYLNLLPIFTSLIAIVTGQDLLSLTKVLAIVLVVGGVMLVTRSSAPANAVKKA